MFNGLIALPGALEILKYCRDNKIKTAVLTNKHGPHARAACDHLGFSPYLEYILGADDTEWKKPDRKLTQLALNKPRHTRILPRRPTPISRWSKGRAPAGAGPIELFSFCD